ncbi:AMP-binding protein [Saccharopolyspora sp. NPDC000995]
MCRGGCGVLVRYREYIKRSGATSALLVPYQLNSVVDHALDCLGGLELLWTGGDVVAGATIERLLNRFPDLRLANGWGLTETTVISTWHLITTPYQAESSVAVGRAMGQCRVYVLDDDLRPVPPGTTGEAYVAGRHLSTARWPIARWHEEPQPR